jgi:hypothetical protein
LHDAKQNNMLFDTWSQLCCPTLQPILSQISTKDSLKAALQRCDALEAKLTEEKTKCMALQAVEREVSVVKSEAAALRAELQTCREGAQNLSLQLIQSDKQRESSVNTQHELQTQVRTPRISKQTVPRVTSSLEFYVIGSVTRS